MQGLIEAKTIQTFNERKEAMENMEAKKFTWGGQRSLTFYKKEFEVQFLHNSSSEYEAKAKLWVASYNALEYLQKADDAFAHEE